MRCVLVALVMLTSAGTAMSGPGVAINVSIERGSFIDLPGERAHCESTSNPGTPDETVVELGKAGRNVRLTGRRSGTTSCYGVTVPGWRGDNRSVSVFVFDSPVRLEAACDKGEAAACRSLGELYLDGVEAGTRLKSRVVLKADAQKAIHLFQRACDDGEARGCLRLAVQYLGGAGFYNPEKAAAMFETLCAQNENLACYALAALYAPFDTYGVHQRIPPDAAKALPLFERACNAGYKPSCNSLGVMYARGLGTAIDAAKATALYKQACDAHDVFGCHNLASGSRTPDLAQSVTSRFGPPEP